MAKIRKRGNSYQIDYFDPTGKRVRKSFSKKKDAEAELGKRVSLVAEGRYLDVKKEYKTTLGELIKKYEENFETQVSFKGWKKLCLSNFKAYFGEDRLLSTIKYVDLETYRNLSRQKITRKGTVRTVAAVNREISCLHHLFTKGKEWELLEENPFNKGKSLLMRENNQRMRYLSQEEIQKLLNASPEHLKNIIICALNTGMRRSEIFSLKWDQVRHGFIYLQKTKTNEPRQIPINDTLAELFERLKRENPGSKYVFLYQNKNPDKSLKAVSLVVDNDKRLDNVKNSFSTALKRSGIEHCTLHDLRHTFASHLLMNGASIKDVQELLGHKTMQMTLRYAHLSQEHKKKAVNLLNGLTAPEKEILSHFVTNPALNPLERDQSSANYLTTLEPTGRLELPTY